MPFLPSLLEYTPQNLEIKLELIKDNLKDFRIIQKSSDNKIHLHLDFVLQQFAINRNIEPSNSLQIVFNMVNKYFGDQKIVCNCHFMGSFIDIMEILTYLKTKEATKEFNSNWEYMFYFGKDMIGMIGYFDSMNNNKNLKAGLWLDFDEWEILKFSENFFNIKNYLLMTVIAGKSGQKLTSNNRSQALEIIKNNSDLNFTIDGGWSVGDELLELDMESKNKLSIISYSSFWDQFDTMIHGI